jgi:hypothetical protein
MRIEKKGAMQKQAACIALPRKNFGWAFGLE